ncbi:MAG: hypothetical protein HYV04_18895 [Deltaproteobacteria bacterium]|nr:hypothetical protein [Deltaproteobacteria bacterium]
MGRTLALSEALDLTTNNLLPFVVEGEYLEKQRRKAVRDGELGLMLAILEDAINCYVKYAPARERRARHQFKEAEEWIFQRGSDWLFSCENICEILGIDPEYLRQGLLRWKQKSHNETHKRPGLRAWPVNENRDPGLPQALRGDAAENGSL